MTLINWGKAVQGGILAGIVMCVGEYFLSQPVLGGIWEQTLETHNMPPVGPAIVGWFIIALLVLGIAMTALYGLIRPRFGSPLTAAVCAGLWVWFFVWFYGYAILLIMSLVPVRIAAVSIGWGLVEAPLAALAGSLLYRQPGQPPSSAGQPAE